MRASMLSRHLLRRSESLTASGAPGTVRLDGSARIMPKPDAERALSEHAVTAGQG
jgi:hypothetical protein